MSNPILKCILKDSDIVRVACTVKLKILQGRNEVVLYLLKKKIGIKLRLMVLILEQKPWEPSPQL